MAVKHPTKDKNGKRGKIKFPTVSIVIVNYNGKKFLRDCLDSVFSLDYPKEKVEVIVVDNGSKDGSIEFIRKKYQKAVLLKNDSNNYARANNLGIKKSHSDFIAFLNNDTKVDRKWLIELIRAIEKDNKIGGVGSKTLLMDGRIDNAGISEFPNFYWSNIGHGEIDRGQYDKRKEVYALNGSAMLFRRKCITEAGMEDEDFDIYVEEIDLAERCKRLGWKLIYCPKSILWHHHGGTINENSEKFVFLTERNRLFFVAKHFPEKFADAISTSHLFYKDITRNHPLLFERILPEAIGKLVKEQDKERIFKILPELYKKIFEISDFERYDFLKGSLEKENEIKSLRKEMLEQNLQAKKNINDAEKKINDAYKQAEKERRENAFLSGVVREKTDELEREKEASRRESDRYEKKIAALKEELRILRQEKDELNDEISFKISEKQSDEMEIMSLKNELARKKREIYLFYNSRGYKYILSPIDKLYRALKKI